MQGVVNKEMKDDFTIIDETGNRIAGETSFIFELFDPDSNLSSILVSVSDLGNGNYRTSFVPDQIGLWKLTVYNTVYFPAGKENSYQIFGFDIDDVKIDTQFISDVEGGDWHIINNQMIFYKSDHTTELFRVNLTKNGAPTVDQPDKRTRV